jgi:membrane protease YdiL (CAAX protease family)
MAQSAPTGRRLQHIGEAILVIFGAYLAANITKAATDPLVISLVGSVVSTNIVEITQTAIQLLTIIGVVALYLRVVDTDRLVRLMLPTPRSVGVIVGGTLVLLGGQYVINQLLQWANFSPGANQAVTAGVGDPLYYLLMVPVSLLLVGPAEELLFRGAVQGRLRESWGRWPAIILATVLFGLIHIPAVSGGFGAQLSYALLAGVLGLVLGYLYDYTQNIVVPSVIHGSYNGTLFALLYLGEIGLL